MPMVILSKIKNAAKYDQQLSNISQITIPNRSTLVKQVYHIYVVRAKRRNQLNKYLNHNGIDAKVHYPIPIYRQEALNKLGYKEGDFPVSDAHTSKIITFPCDQHLDEEQLDHIIKTVKGFYSH